MLNWTILNKKRPGDMKSPSMENTHRRVFCPIERCPNGDEGCRNGGTNHPARQKMALADTD